MIEGYSIRPNQPIKIEAKHNVEEEKLRKAIDDNKLEKIMLRYKKLQKIISDYNCQTDLMD